MIFFGTKIQVLLIEKITNYCLINIDDLKAYEKELIRRQHFFNENKKENKTYMLQKSQ